MTRLLLLFSLLFTALVSNGQRIETIYLDPADSTANKYIVVHPPSQPYKGFAFFIPGMFQQGADVLVQTDLPMHAAQQGILTFIPTFNQGIGSFGFDTATHVSFLEMLDHVTAKYKLDGLRFYAGGFSIGGTCAIKYAELALANNFPIKPAAVFAIDSPLDFERLYKGMMREIRLPNSCEFCIEESTYILKRCHLTFGGSPDENLESYYNQSPYSFNDTTQRAIKPLANLPIRLYAEPDIMWWLTEGVDYSMLNSYDFAALTNELKRMGNKNVALMISTDRGFRKPNNERHPHSWSLVDPEDLVRWMLMFD